MVSAVDASALSGFWVDVWEIFRLLAILKLLLLLFSFTVTLLLLSNFWSKGVVLVGCYYYYCYNYY